MHTSQSYSTRLLRRTQAVEKVATRTISGPEPSSKCQNSLQPENWWTSLLLFAGNFRAVDAGFEPRPLPCELQVPNVVVVYQLDYWLGVGRPEGVDSGIAGDFRNQCKAFSGLCLLLTGLRRLEIATRCP